VSLIGTLEQFNLALVLQRIEAHEKTGLFKIQQGTRWVDLYLREGRLMCISKQHVDMPLGERLVKSGVISAQDLQQAIFATGEELPDETRLVITLMDLGSVEREELRAWATKEAIQVLQELLTLTSGELYFEEEVPPPVGRLLVSLSLSTLLSAISARAGTPGISQKTRLVPEQETVRTKSVNAPAIVESRQFEQESETQYPSLTPDLPDTSLSAVNLLGNLDALPLQSLQQEPVRPPQPDIDPLIPTPVATPVLPGRIDTSFLLPDTILMPVDLSLMRNSSQRVQITPPQWCLLTRVDGRTTLRTACMQLGLLPEVICQLAGELLAMGLVSIALPGAVNDGIVPASQQMMSGVPVSSSVAPAAVATTANPWRAGVAPMPASDVLASAYPAPASGPLETQSQWGNGANGAMFVPGRGWVTGPQPSLAPANSSSPLYVAGTR